MSKRLGFYFTLSGSRRRGGRERLIVLFYTSTRAVVSFESSFFFVRFASFSKFFTTSVKFSPLESTSAGKNDLVNMVEDSLHSPSSSIESDKYEKRISSSSLMIQSSVRKSAERGRFWSAVRFRRRFGIGSMMVLAIVVFNLMFALGKCGPLEREQRRQNKITVTVTHLDFFDADDVQRGAATMGGRIKMSLSAPDLQCTSGVVSLFDGGGKFLGQAVCSNIPIFEFKVREQLTLGQFKIKTNEMESGLFDTYIHYILVNRPTNVKECENKQVYAKDADGTKCIELTESNVHGDRKKRSAIAKEETRESLAVNLQTYKWAVLVLIIIAVFASLAVVVVMCGCGGKKKKAADETGESKKKKEAEAEKTEAKVEKKPKGPHYRHMPPNFDTMSPKAKSMLTIVEENDSEETIKEQNDARKSKKNPTVKKSVWGL